ncbi:MAG: lipid IV(A) palmitoyltransferase PagP [Legionellaceae bacterium]|nr:lipid IV(A) palmitoyltransferase PagP [Legionellaceae bacterium]
MRKAALLLLLVLFGTSLFAESTQAEYCADWSGLLRRPCQRLKQLWYEGEVDLVLSGYAWHNRYTYSAEKIKSYNEKAFGGGFGKSFIDEDGDLHGLYALGFADSHRNLQTAAGYAFLKNWALARSVSIGLGVTALVTARPDINKGIPFPGALPLLGLRLQRATLFATYIPGAAGAGNVLFIFGKWQLTGS